MFGRFSIFLEELSVLIRSSINYIFLALYPSIDKGFIDVVIECYFNMWVTRFNLLYDIHFKNKIILLPFLFFFFMCFLRRASINIKINSFSVIVILVLLLVVVITGELFSKTDNINLSTVNLTSLSILAFITFKADSDLLALIVAV